MPSQRHHALGRNVNIRIGLCFSCQKAPYPDAGHAYLHRIQHLDHAWVAQRSQLSQSILSKGKSRLVRGDIEGKNAAVRSVFLQGQGASISSVLGISSGSLTYSLGAIVESPDGLVDVNSVAKAVGERWPLSYGRGDCRLEEIHIDRSVSDAFVSVRRSFDL